MARPGAVRALILGLGASAAIAVEGQATDSSAAIPRNDSASVSDTVRRISADSLTPLIHRRLPNAWDSGNRPPFPGAPLLITLPAADFPYSLQGGFQSLSMRQTLMLNAGATQFGDQTIAWLWYGKTGFWPTVGRIGSEISFVYLFTYLPPGDAWLHEEWHRAMLTRRGMGSYDGIYHWDIGAGIISVDHVEDADLAALKDRHPAEFTRLSEAGAEGEIESVRLMRRRNFFLGRPSQSDALGWWVSGIGTTAYLWACTNADEDGTLRDANQREKNVSQRDFTGLDFRAWVHDLRRPDESYAAGPRGRTHPAGSGFDRYLLDSDLTPGEKTFLKWQAGLSILNLMSGEHLGIDWMPGSNPWTGSGYLWNFALTHHLTSFGYTVGGEFLARQGKANWVFTVDGLLNAKLFLPALGAELFRYPVALGRKQVYLSGNLSAWLQPEDQLFHTSSVEPGAMALAGAAVPLGQYLEFFAEADAKTAGWVAGNAYLDAALQARAGLQLRL